MRCINLIILITYLYFSNVLFAADLFNKIMDDMDKEFRKGAFQNEIQVGKELLKINKNQIGPYEFSIIKLRIIERLYHLGLCKLVPKSCN